MVIENGGNTTFFADLNNYPLQTRVEKGIGEIANI